MFVKTENQAAFFQALKNQVDSALIPSAHSKTDSMELKVLQSIRFDETVESQAYLADSLRRRTITLNSLIAEVKKYALVKEVFNSEDDYYEASLKLTAEEKATHVESGFAGCKFWVRKSVPLNAELLAFMN